MKKAVKKLFNALGFDIIRLKKSSQHTLLGLKNLPVKTIIDVGANEGQFAKKFLQMQGLVSLEKGVAPFLLYTNKLRNYINPRNKGTKVNRETGLIK